MSSIHQPTTIALLAIGMALTPAFILWVGRQERLGKPAIVPNSLWRNKVFTPICIGVFLTWGMFNAVENYVSFTFQYVQEVSAIQTSLRFLPEPAGGAVTNLVMGLVVDRVRADWAVLVTTSVSAISCLLMAVIDINASYWAFAFPSTQSCRRRHALYHSEPPYHLGLPSQNAGIGRRRIQYSRPNLKNCRTCYERGHCVKHYRETGSEWCNQQRGTFGRIQGCFLVLFRTFSGHSRHQCLGFAEDWEGGD